MVDYGLPEFPCFLGDSFIPERNLVGNWNDGLLE